MSIQEFRQEVLDHYMEADDLFVSPVRSPGHWSTGNGLLYSSFFYSILLLNGCLTEEDRVRFITMVDRCWAVPGLLNRGKNRPDENAQDDYHIATASYLVQTDHAKAIYAYGRDNKFSYDNQNPNKFKWSKWHGRFPGRPGYYALCAGEEPGCVQDKLIKIDIASGPSKDAGALMQQWLRNQIYRRFSPYAQQVIDWEARFMSKYMSLSTAIKGEMGNNPEHPFVKYNINVYGAVLG